MAEKDEKKPVLKKVERVLFHSNFFDSGVVKYAAGQHYPKTPETESQALAGHAKIVPVEMDAEEHEAQHKAAHAALASARKATIAAEDDARKRGLLE